MKQENQIQAPEVQRGNTYPVKTIPAKGSGTVRRSMCEVRGQGCGRELHPALSDVSFLLSGFLYDMDTVWALSSFQANFEVR